MDFDLTTGPVATRLATLAALTALGMLAIVGFAVSDAYFVGLLGKEALAAITYCFPFILLFSGIGLGLGVGAEVGLAPIEAAGDVQRKRVFSTRAVVLVVVVSVIASLGVYAATPDLVGWLDADPVLRPNIELYLRLWIWGVPPLLLALMGGSIARAIGDMTMPAVVMITASLLNLVLDPILIFGIEGWLQPMGFAGAAWATLVTRALAGVWTAWLLVFRYDVLTPTGLVDTETWTDWSSIVRLGTPPGLMQMVAPAGQAVLLKLMSVFPVAVVGAAGLALQVEALAFIGFVGINIALGPFIGQNLGAGKVDRVREAVRVSLIGVALAGVALTLFFQTAGPRLLPLLHADPLVAEVLVAFFVTVGLTYMVEGSRFVASPLFNNTGSSVPPLVLTSIEYFVVLLPAVWWVREPYGWHGVLAAVVVSRLVTTALAMAWLRHRMGQLPAST